MVRFMVFNKRQQQDGVSEDASYHDLEPVEVPIDGILDLHTFNPGEVSSLVREYLVECRRAGITEVKIIHGKGKGILRRSVHAVLERVEFVHSWRLAPPENGHWGATIVHLDN